MVWFTNSLNMFLINLDSQYGTNFSEKQTVVPDITPTVTTNLVNPIENTLFQTFGLNFLNFISQYGLSFYILFTIVMLGWFFTNLVKNLQNNKLVVNILSFVENEFNNFASFKWVLFNLLFFFFVNFHWFFMSYLTSPAYVVFLDVAVILLSLILAISVYLINNYGFFFIIYLKGSTSKNSINMELVTDLINLVSYFSRIFLQLVRLVIILGTFFLYNEVYLEYIYPTLNYTIYTPSSILDVVVVSLQIQLKIILHFLYELVHFFVLFLTQSTAFNMVILILLQFLYTSFTDTNLENFFTSKRNF